MLWLWELKDVGIMGLGLLISVLALARLGTMTPLVFTVLFGFLSIRVEDTSVLEFLRRAAEFLVLSQQRYEWRARVENDR